jgi:ABC-2 type transport system ATP-binding protein
VLILDEPTNGLDPEGVRWLRQFLRSHADRGGTVLVSSHLLAEVAQTVDDVVILAAGRLVRQCSLLELAQEATPSVWVRTPQLDALRYTLAGHGISTGVAAPDALIAADTTTEFVGQVAAGAGIVLHEMRARQFDLEQYFLALTNPEGAAR